MKKHLISLKELELMPHTALAVMVLRLRYKLDMSLTEIQDLRKQNAALKRAKMNAREEYRELQKKYLMLYNASKVDEYVGVLKREP